MKTTPDTKFKTIAEYLSALPAKQQRMLKELRNIIKEAAPEAKELISYNMPAMKLNGMLVWYAAYNGHIGLYPTPSAIKVFKEDLAAFKTSKGAVQFPLDKAIPVALVKKIVKFRVKENEGKGK